jgi:hypothetical protein
MTAITVAEMIEALSRMPQDAKLVITESGYYSYQEFADIMMPELYTAESQDEQYGIAKGEHVVRIGHSHQSY